MIIADELLDQMADMPDEPEVTLVDKQVVADIIRYMPWKLRRCRPYYDLIWMFFESDSVEGVGEGLYDFLKDQMTYIEEDDEAQRLSSPKEMLERGDCDCKGYALFVAGVVDAINRNTEEPIKWCFRFVPSTLLGVKIGHVFVVLDPGASEVWVDPVLSSFNQKPFYAVRKDRYVSDAETVSGLVVDVSGNVVGNAEANLLGQLNEYTLGLQDAMQVTIGNKTINSITLLVLQTASTFIPGVSLALGLLKDGTALLSNSFGPGSLSARLFSDLSTNLLTAPVTLVQSILNGRTFNSDQYWGATYYYYFVEGQTKYLNNPNQVSDAQVIPALKWFIDRLGVFISGREHIIALTQSAQAYMNLYSVNSDTTTDINQVNPAVAVAQQYFNFNGAAGSWNAVQGVYDATLVAIATEQGESVEDLNNQLATGEAVIPGVTAEGLAPVVTIQDKLQAIAQNPVAWLALAAAVLLIGISFLDDD